MPSRRGLVISDEQMRLIEAVLERLRAVSGSQVRRPHLHERPAHRHLAPRTCGPTPFRWPRWRPVLSRPPGNWPRS